MNFEDLVISMVDSITTANYNLIGTIVALIAIIFWVVVTSWIWVDSDERTTNKWIRIFYVVIGMIPIFGWIIYLIVRPPETIDEIYWGDLERRYLKYEAKDLGDCPKCGTQLYPGYIFCPNCKKRIKIKCAKCGVYVDLDSKYCTHCGNQLKNLVVKEEEISHEEMQKQIEETKEEAHETVKSKKSKYKQEQNFLHRVGESIKKGYSLLGEKIGNIFEKDEEDEEEIKEQEEKPDKKTKGEEIKKNKK